MFPAPARAVLDASDYEDAKRCSKEATGKYVSMQAFVILPKIREADEFLRHDAKARRLVREVHPEVSFWAFNNNCAMKHSKKKEGFCERMGILKRTRPVIDQEIRDILNCFERKEVVRDDAVDAMAAEVTAAREAAALRTPPPCPERDSAGLPMEMVHAGRRMA